MPHSHHSHSGAYCAHASSDSSPTSMLEVAHKSGFHLYCLSEHVPRSKGIHLYPEELEAKLKPSDLLERFEDYLVAGRKCAEVWHGRMQVLVGAELENIDDENIKDLESVLNKGSHGKTEEANVGAKAGMGRVDYLIGSLHHVDSIPIDFDQATFESALENFKDEEDGEDEEIVRRKAHLRLMRRYLDQQHDLIEHFEPEVIGHFDLCRLYQPDTPMATIASQTDREPLLEELQEAVQRNIRLVCRYGGLFEVSSASIRKGWSTPYPGADVLDCIITNGGRLCLSDDAHSHDQVGLNYHKVKEYLESRGVDAIWKLETNEESTSSPVSSTCFPRGTRAVKVTGWASDSFWES
ncbi:hypothetical protein CBS101457_004516 [Exobasidium rhododendri]|nr:hypothetical protein CBS101457_004516 [Exobasidium rhododendri]